MKVLIWALLSLAVVACNGGKSYVLNGKIDGTSVEQAYLAIGENIDTVEVEEGVFEFKGKLDNPTMGTLLIEGRQISIMLENTEMSIEGAIENLNYEEALITGSASQLEFEAFIKDVKEHSTSKEAYVAFCETYIKEHPESFFTPYVIAGVASLFTPEQMLEMMEPLSPQVAATKTATELKEQLKKMMGMSVGAQAPDFTMNDANGQPVTLSKVYAQHKYLLIDFWASWCSPCRAENPNVVAAYNAYNAKGFGILGVSLDKDKEAWLKAIEDDKLTWENVSDLKGWENAAAQDYAVKGIPANFLVDNTGKIVAKSLRGPALEAKLKELLD